VSGGYVIVFYVHADGTCVARAPDVSGRVCGLTFEEAREEIHAEVEFRCAVGRAAGEPPPAAEAFVQVERFRIARPGGPAVEHLVVFEFSEEDGFVARLRGGTILAETRSLFDAMKEAVEELENGEEEDSASSGGPIVNGAHIDSLVDIRTERYTPTGEGAAPPPRTRIDVRRLIETGECGPFRVGMTLDELYQLAGPPDSTGFSFRPRSKRDLCIWRYGWFPYVEFDCRYRDGDFRVYHIRIDVLWSDGRVPHRNVEIEPWIALRETTPAEFWERAEREGLVPTRAFSDIRAYGYPQTWLVYAGDPETTSSGTDGAGSSGVGVLFQVNFEDPDNPSMVGMTQHIYKVMVPPVPSGE
jgi:hypothetical protein